MFSLFRGQQAMALEALLLAPMPRLVRQASWPRTSRPPGYRAHRRWKRRRATGRS